jgi:hypothetical protein
MDYQTRDIIILKNQCKLSLIHSATVAAFRHQLDYITWMQTSDNQTNAGNKY